MQHSFFSQLAILITAGAAARAQEVTLRVASETFPAGGFAQIKVFADSPALIAGGVLSLDLDPQVFGPITSISAFSPSGDAAAAANVLGTHVDATVGAPSGGLGQLPGLPVFVVRAPVLPNAPSSGSVSLSVPEWAPFLPMSGVASRNYPEDAWTDPTGRPLRVTLVPGRATISGDTPSIDLISPGTGLHPIGTQLEVTGTGFAASQRITADGLPLTDIQFVSPTLITAKMGAARELTGVAFHLAYSPTQQIDFFAAPPSAVPAVDPPPEVSLRKTHVVLPLIEQRTALVSGHGRAYSTIMLNASRSSIDVLVRVDGLSAPTYSRTLTIAPGEISAIHDGESLAQTFIDSPSPLRIVSIYTVFGGLGLESVRPSDRSPRPLETPPSPSRIDIAYQTGSAPPVPQTARIIYRQSIQDVAVKINAGPWLKVAANNTASQKELTLTFDVAGFAPGSYKGIITITPRVPANLQGFPVRSSILTVSLNVTNQPSLKAQPNFPDSNVGQISPSSLDVTTNGTPSVFTVRTVSNSSVNWFSADIASGTTPARINLRADPSAPPKGLYDGKVFIEGPVNTLEYSVVMGAGSPPFEPFQAQPPNPTLAIEIGAPRPQTSGTVSFLPVHGSFTYTARTEDGGNWLLTALASTPGPSYAKTVSFTIDPTVLATGTYHATITGTADSETAQATVMVHIIGKPTAPPSATPSALSFTTRAGTESANQTITLASAQPALLSGPAFGPQVRVLRDPTFPTPLPVADLMVPARFTVTAYSDFPGHFEGAIRFSTQGGSISIPYTVDVTARPEQPPALASVLNAASHRPTALAPGEIITIHGFGIGPATTGLTLDTQGRVRSDVNTNSRVIINGVAAPIAYASPNQWNVVVPYEIEGSAAAEVQVFVNGIASAKWMLPVAASAPAIFTQTSNGVGAASVLNQDNTVNGPSNRAPAGTVVQIYANGAGPVIPAATTGSVTAAPGSTRLGAKVFFGSTQAAVTYAGPAPGFVAGVLQINAIAPQVPLGGDLPLQIQIGDTVSPTTTISISQ